MYIIRMHIYRADLKILVVKYYDESADLNHLQNV